VQLPSVSLNSLRGRLAQILALERQQPVDWDQVARLSATLLSELGPYAPLIVRAYLHDVDLRKSDGEFAASQQARIAAYLASAEPKQNR
jgi:hypothetical protein